MFESAASVVCVVIVCECCECAIGVSGVSSVSVVSVEVVAYKCRPILLHACPVWAQECITSDSLVGVARGGRSGIYTWTGPELPAQLCLRCAAISSFQIHSNLYSICDQFIINTA